MIDTKKLRSDLSSDKKEEALERLIADIDNLVEAFNEMKTATTELKKTSDDLLEVNGTLNKACLDYVEALKNIHTILGTNDQEKIELLKTDLAKWIVSSSSILAGVVTNGNDTASYSTSNERTKGT